MTSRPQNVIGIFISLLLAVIVRSEVRGQMERLAPSTMDLGHQLDVGEAVPDGGARFYDDRHLLPPTYPVWEWRLLPDSLMYQSYLAGVKEPRMGSTMLYHDKSGWVWDHTIGARMGALRYGTPHDERPEGWQLDVEAGTYLRQDPEDRLDLIGSDFRFGIPLTYAQGPWHTKLAYYHLSAHLADEFLLKNPDLRRINYVRDALVWGVGYYATDSLRLYGEAAWAFKTDGGAEPWEFQIGADFSPRIDIGFCGTPFFAISGHLRQEFNFGGNLNVQAGWQWRSGPSGRVLRAGVQYFNGPSPLYEFFDRHEELIGFGLWYDF